MKILIYNDWKTLVGGAERYIHNLLPLISQDNNIRFIAAEDVLSLKKIKIYQRKLSFWQNNRILSHYLHHQIESFKPDIIHLNNVYYFSESVFSVIKLSGIPVVFTLHDYQFIDLSYDKPWQNLLKFLKRRKLHSVAQMFIAPSQKIYTLASEQLFKNVHYLPHFIDTKKWPYKLSNSYSELKLLYVGNIDRIKGVFFLLNVLELISTMKIKASITYVGVGKDEKELKNEIECRELSDRVLMVGYQNDLNIQQFFSHHFVLLLPSLIQESFCLTGLEAQAVGLPVIVSNLGGVAEWATDNETAIFATANNVNDWCSKICLLWDNEILYNHIRSKAVNQVIDKFQPMPHCKNLMSYYHKII
jgi:glycosyltransferase involved in cell wall biosynthesis